MPYVMQLDSLAAGPGLSPYDGQFLVEYDPNRRGRDPDGHETIAHFAATPDINAALRFDSIRELIETWRQESTRWPYEGRLDDDGKPNRPLTAFTITALRVP